MSQFKQKKPDTRVYIVRYQLCKVQKQAKLIHGDYLLEVGGVRD